MSVSKFKMKMFIKKGDFSIWRKIMKDILVQQKVVVALESKKNLLIIMFDVEKKELLETTYSTIISYLSDNAVRQVDNATTIIGIWLR